MSAMPKTKLTVQEYLERDRSAEVKSEYFDSAMREVERKTPAHNFISVNLMGEIRTRLKGGPFSLFASTMRMQIEATDRFAYPDPIIYRLPFQASEMDRDTLANPTALIEITSDNTFSFDHSAKLRHYMKIPTFMEYILVSQDEAACDRYIRQADGSWALLSFVGLDAELVFTSVPARIPLAAIYAGVTFE